MRSIVLAVFLLVVLCVPAHAGEIKIEGGGTSISTVFQPIKRRYEKMHGDYLTIVQSSAVKGLIALNEGKVDIAACAHPLEDIIAGAAMRGVVLDRSRFVATEVGENELVVIANRDSAVTRLSKEQLKGIFTGRIGNWKQVGGKDMAVTVVWGKETEGQNVQFTRIALDGEPVTEARHSATTHRNIAETVAALPGSVGVVSRAMSTAATRSIDTIAMASPIYAITRGNPSPKVQSVIDFYKTEFGFLQ